MRAVGSIGIVLPMPILPQRNDGHLLCDGVAVKGRSRLAGARSAALEGDAVAKHHRHAVRQQVAAGTLHQGKSIASGDMLGGSPYHRVDPTPVSPSPFFDCGSEAAEPHIRLPLIAAGTKIPHARGRRARKGGPIFIAAFCSQDVMRSARRDQARVSFPRGWLGTP